MKTSKGFAGIGILIAIIAVLAIGGVAYYKNKSLKTEPVNLEEDKDNLPQENQGDVVNVPVQNNQVDNNVDNTPKQNDHILNSETFGYSIGYSGIDNINVEGDGANVFLFKDQSQTDLLKIVDSSYVMPNYILLVGTVTFGTNQYQKFKDNVTPRHTYYFKSGLQNGKAIFISVENDSDNPTYLDLSSLVIQ